MHKITIIICLLKSNYCILPYVHCTAGKLVSYMYVLRVAIFFFSVNVPPLEYCQIDLSQDNHDALVYAVKNHYWYQMYIGMSACVIF